MEWRGNLGRCGSLRCFHRAASTSLFQRMRRSHRKNLCDDVALSSGTDTFQEAFFLNRRMKSCEVQFNTSKNFTSKQNCGHGDPQTCKTEGKVFSASWVSGVNPSAPNPPRTSSNEAAKAFAAAQVWTAISSSMLAPPFRAGWEVPATTWPSPTGSRRNEFPLTTFHRHHQPTQPNGRGREVR